MLILKIMGGLFFVMMVLGIYFPKSSDPLEIPRNPMFFIGLAGCIVVIITSIFFGSNLHFPGG